VNRSRKGIESPNGLKPKREANMREQDTNFNRTKKLEDTLDMRIGVNCQQTLGRPSGRTQMGTDGPPSLSSRSRTNWRGRATALSIACEQNPLSSVFRPFPARQTPPGSSVRSKGRRWTPSASVITNPRVKWTKTVPMLNRLNRVSSTVSLSSLNW
jgi:hypothetical protein